LINSSKKFELQINQQPLQGQEQSIDLGFEAKSSPQRRVNDEMWLRVVETGLAHLPVDVGELSQWRTTRIVGGANPRSGGSCRARAKVCEAVAQTAGGGGGGPVEGPWDAHTREGSPEAAAQWRTTRIGLGQWRVREIRVRERAAVLNRYDGWDLRFRVASDEPMVEK
jgi:hypothetical protein